MAFTLSLSPCRKPNLEPIVSRNAEMGSLSRQARRVKNKKKEVVDRVYLYRCSSLSESGLRGIFSRVGPRGAPSTDG